MDSRPSAETATPGGIERSAGKAKRTVDLRKK